MCPVSLLLSLEALAAFPGFKDLRWMRGLRFAVRPAERLGEERQKKRSERERERCDAELVIHGLVAMV